METKINFHKKIGHAVVRAAVGVTPSLWKALFASVIVVKGTFFAEVAETLGVVPHKNCGREVFGFLKNDIACYAPKVAVGC